MHAASAAFSSISISDIGLAAATILADPSKHINKAYTLGNKPYTHAELAKAFADAIGKKVPLCHILFRVVMRVTG